MWGIFVGICVQYKMYYTVQHNVTVWFQDSCSRVTAVVSLFLSHCFVQYRYVVNCIAHLKREAKAVFKIPHNSYFAFYTF